MAAVVDQIEVQKLKQQLQVAHAAEQMYIAKATDWEKELQGALVPLSAKQKALQMLKSECTALKEKRIAADEEIKWRKNMDATLAKQFAESANRFQNQLCSKMEWERSTRDACNLLKAEERRLSSLATNLDGALQDLIIAYHEEDCAENRHVPSQSCLNLGLEAAQRAESEAATAASTLANARRQQERFKQFQASQERALKEAAKWQMDELQSLQDKDYDLVVHHVRIEKSIESWHYLHSIYKRNEDRNLRAADQAMQDDYKPEMLGDKLKAVRQRCGGLRMVEWRMLQWRRVAAVSPVLAAWLVSAWWLCIMNQ